MNPTEEARQISQVIVRLLTKFQTASYATVEAAVEDALAHYAETRPRDLVPLLVEHTATATLASSPRTCIPGSSDLPEHLHAR
ncbi:hypothetical protein RHA1_ro03114 [Rhodococcus jostii RHA1]|uniref:Uncharacterized protein n=1 Tax=Rhodococcus jostii (strain RHA1) TaxID=101510 RepID=Q0SC19_RHOJR|nr:hypothetical protein [Rhodococcus jostii]ABG94917.1 hypothetical protein RHA1_ro03114 [Rhodococcus jostii RHA1]